MKRTLKRTLLLFLLSSLSLFANINVVVSIVPEKTFVKAIGGDKVNVMLMVLPGNSPHTYEPKPSQMTAIAKADLYFAIDVEFEHVWLPKFQSLNQKMHMINLSDGVTKIAMREDHHVHETHEGHDGKDPHIWTSPANVKIIAQNIYKALSTIDSDNTKYYENNLKLFLDKIDHTDKQIKEHLSTLKGSRKFMVFHPSWGYFAKAYNLEQIAVEIEGKTPKPKDLVHLIKKAKEEKVSAIITQPEFSDASAKVIANELHIPVVKISPMAENWSENLITMAKIIAGHK